MVFLLFLAKPCAISTKTVAEIYGIYIKSVQCSFTVTSNGSIFSTGYIFNHVRDDVTKFFARSYF